MLKRLGARCVYKHGSIAILVGNFSHSPDDDTMHHYYNYRCQIAGINNNWMVRERTNDLLSTMTIDLSYVLFLLLNCKLKTQVFKEMQQSHDFFLYQWLPNWICICIICSCITPSLYLILGESIFSGQFNNLTVQTDVNITLVPERYSNVISNFFMWLWLMVQPTSPLAVSAPVQLVK